MPIDTLPEQRLGRTEFSVITIIALILGIFALGSDELVISPILLDLSQSLSAPIDLASLSVSIYGLALGICALILAPISDRYSRQMSLIFGIILFSLATLLCAFSFNMPIFLISRALSGLVAGLFVPNAYAFVGDKIPFERRGRVMGMIVSSWSLSLIIGVPLGSFINQWLSWRWIFLILAMIGFLVSLLLFMTREGSSNTKVAHSKVAQTHLSFVHSILAGTRTQGVLPLTLATFCNMFGFYGMYTFLGSFLRSIFPQGSSIAGTLILIYGLGFAASSFTGKIADKVGKERSLLFSLVLLAAILIFLPHIASFIPVLLPAFFLWGAMQSLAVTMLSTLISECSEAHRGQIMGLYSLATNLAVALGAGLMGVLYVNRGYSMVSSVCAITTVAGFFFTLLASVRKGDEGEAKRPVR